MLKDIIIYGAIFCVGIWLNYKFLISIEENKELNKELEERRSDGVN